MVVGLTLLALGVLPPTDRIPVPRLAPARCAAGLARCRSARGRVVLVQRHDPDGDGDLHVIVTGGSVTGPGVTAVDVAAGLRPARDPRLGDLATAAGPVQTGTWGQQQIHAVAFRVQPRR
jgi:hypothetical protein